MSDASPAFRPQQFSDLPHFFSTEEHTALVKWGTHATELTDGTVSPVSAKEAQFVEVARGISAPATRFQRIWLRYLQLVELQKRLVDASATLSAESLTLNLANATISQLRSEVHRLEIWGKAGWARKATPVGEGIVPNSTCTMNNSSTNDVAGERNAIRLMVANLKNRDDYLLLIKNGLHSLSDTQVFQLYNVVDGIGLNDSELQAFVTEHEHRRYKYRPTGTYVGKVEWGSEWGYDNGMGVYANIDGQ